MQKSEKSDFCDRSNRLSLKWLLNGSKGALPLLARSSACLKLFNHWFAHFWSFLQELLKNENKIHFLQKWHFWAKINFFEITKIFFKIPKYFLNLKKDFCDSKNIFLFSCCFPKLAPCKSYGFKQARSFSKINYFCENIFSKIIFSRAKIIFWNHKNFRNLQLFQKHQPPIASPLKTLSNFLFSDDFREK